MNEPPRLSAKSLRVLRLIADGKSYTRIVDSDADLNYHDIFFAAEEALWVDERLAAWLSETQTAGRARPTVGRTLRRHARKYETWSKGEDDELAAMHSSGKNKTEMAKELQRQTSAITHRLRELRLIKD